jgi:broad-specificity NMP kinase
MERIKFELIIIRGAPGVGKSELSRRIRKVIPQGVTIEVDAIRGMINGTKWVDSQEHAQALRASWAVCRSYMQEGFRPIVLVDTFTPNKLGILHDLITRDAPDLNGLTISLYCEDDELKKRITGREDGFKNLELSVKINQEVTKYRRPFEVFIDTTTMTKEEVLDEVLKVIRED